MRMSWVVVNDKHNFPILLMNFHASFSNLQFKNLSRPTFETATGIVSFKVLEIAWCF